MDVDIQFINPEEGYYRVKYHGQWQPMRVWLEDGDRDPETGELMSDQIWRAEWNPSRNSPFAFYLIDPFDFLAFANTITQEEFQWLLILKTL